LDGREVYFNEDLDLPNPESIEWLNGFEWKGVFIRVQTETDSKYLFNEVKALNYLFFEYIQIIDSHKETSKGYLSDELIFPLISYARVCGVVIMCSVCINKYNYEILDSSNKNDNPFIRYEPKIDLTVNRTNFKENNRINTTGNNNSYDISNIVTENNNHNNVFNQNNNSFNNSLNISINRDFNLASFCRDDLNNSTIFAKLSERHLIKVIDDLYETHTHHPEHNFISPRFKFMIISASELLPNLIDFEASHPDYLYIDQNVGKQIQYFNDVVNEDFLKTNLINNLNEQIKNSNNIQEYNFNGLGYKIFNDSNTGKDNSRVKNYFINFASSNVNIPADKLELFDKLAFPRFDEFKSKVLEKNINITGDCLIMYNHTDNVKLKYSLIKSNIDYSKPFIDRTNFGVFIENFAKLLDSNITIDNPNSLKTFFHKYGVNTSLEFFILPKLRSVKLASLIKLNILAKTIKDFYNFHEGLNFITKINLINLSTAGGSNTYIAENSKILKNGFFDFIQEKCIQDIQKHKIYCIILAVLQVSKCHKSFANYFYESLGYFFFTRLLKLRLLNKHTNFNVFNSSVIKQDMLLHDFISTAKKHPFMFLNAIEYHLKIQIDPLIKFKASLSLENFLSIFNDVSILDQEPKVNSYIQAKELSYYILTRFIHTNRHSTRYDNFKDNLSDRKNLSVYPGSTNDSKVNNTITLNNAKLLGKVNNRIVNNPNVMTTKMNQRTDFDMSRNFADYSNISRLSQIPMNSNNITRVNYFNDFNLEDRNEEEAMLKARIWETMSHDLDLMFPPVLYKMVFKSDEKCKRDIYRSLKHHYSITKIDVIRDWKSSLEILLSDIITTDSSESIQLQPLILMFINSFLIELDYNLCKEILNKIRESLKLLFKYNLELLAVVNLLEGLITERKNYIECEQSYSKCLIFSMLNYGDPRGRGCFGNSFMLFPLWKVGRQTCILENLLTSENFREMFYCQDYIFKNMVTTTQVNNFFDNTVNYARETVTNNKPNLNMSDIHFEDDDINEYAQKENYILENNFLNLVKSKYFAFPSISDVKTSYAGFFYSEGFVTFLVKNMLLFTNLNTNLYDEDLLTKLRLNFNSVGANATVDASVSKMTIMTETQKSRKGNIFSTYMYDYLLDKLNYKKSAPGNIVLSWGANRHNETSHNVL
jgi:hypothetical protein